MRVFAKQLFRIALSVCIILAITAFLPEVPFLAGQDGSASSVVIDGICYELSGDPEEGYYGVACVAGFEPGSDESVLVIPEEIEVPARRGKTRIYLVTGIKDGAFAMSSLESVSLPDSLRSIGKCAFFHCEDLKETVIPRNVESIGEGAFSYCNCISLKVSSRNKYFKVKKHVLYSKDMTDLVCADSARKGKFSVPEGVIRIAPYAFEGNSRITSVIMPDSVTVIGQKAFFDCSALMRVDIPASVKKIEGNPFMYCGALTTLKVDKENKKYCATGDGLLLSSDKRSLISASAASGNVSIPSKVYYIEPYAAAGNARIESVSFNKKLKKIKEAAFYDCSHLGRITFAKGSFSIESDEKAFGNCAYFMEVSIPYSSYKEGSLAGSIRENSPAGTMIITR